MKTFILAAALMLGLQTIAIAQQPVNQGRIVDSYTTIESIGETLVHRTIQVPDPVTGEQKLMMQVLRQNNDGSLSLVPTMISKKLKRHHERYCAQDGGIDVTSHGTRTISPETVDAFVCSYPSEESNDPRSLSDSSDRSEQGGRMSANGLIFEANSGSI